MPSGQAKPKEVLYAQVGGVRPPYEVYVFYTDGSVEYWLVMGSVEFPPGTPVFDYRHRLEPR